MSIWTPRNRIEVMAKAIESGEELTPYLLDTAADGTVAPDIGAEVSKVATNALNTRFAKLLAGTPGDALIESLRPRFDDALARVEAAAELFAPDATAADVLELGTAAADAWRDLPQARQVLDGIFDGVVSWLAVDLKGPEVFAGRPHLTDNAHHIDVLRVAFLVKTPGRAIDELAHALAPTGAGTARAGRWHRLIATLGLDNVRLNTVSEARAVLDYYQQQKDEATQAWRDRNRQITEDYRTSVSR
ncbi:hypothetical protein [Rhodococcus phenolicus]|uniref:hypothetical protein n=1 Tax=Rhodococcus phenolicus TaxID=263849 RepID=UPI0012E86636|nr:hypothetical protein [Rhodococcus phenolicus]